jgi:hypothetical protein
MPALHSSSQSADPPALLDVTGRTAVEQVGDHDIVSGGTDAVGGGTHRRSQPEHRVEQENGHADSLPVPADRKAAWADRLPV